MLPSCSCSSPCPLASGQVQEAVSGSRVLWCVVGSAVSAGARVDWADKGLLPPLLGDLRCHATRLRSTRGEVAVVA